MEKNNPLAKFGQILLGLVIIAVLVFAANNIGKLGRPNNNRPDNADMEINKTLSAMASKFNETAPFMIDENTRFDNMIALPGNVLQGNFTAINMTKDEIDPDYFENELKPMVINQIQTNPDMQNFRKHSNVTIRYYYKDKNGVFIAKIEVTPDNYE
ncbi:MAG: hypothetical protein LBT27_08695 [Prevotellaceae bacterium]|jgi:hypothetical protein|nr:hypothetical protein [Prevotellaceae bacterium]